MRTIIIDDEAIGIKTLEVLLHQHVPEIKIIATETDPLKAISLIDKNEPEILFLDVSMPKMSAFELLDKLSFKNFKLVFTTAHPEYAIKAIKSRAFDYLLKPIDITELKACTAKIFEEKNHEHAPSEKQFRLIELPMKGGIVFVKPRDIIRIEASGSYSNFYLVNNVRHMISKNLKEMEPFLDERIFFRCHASHIVNLHQVIKLINSDGLFSQMSDGSKPEISRSQKDRFLEKLKTLPA